jgi:hypothetical protein
MKAMVHLVIALLLSWPGLVWAEDAPQAGYRGIATILWDAFGRKALYVGAPVMAVIIYFLLPSS